MIVFLAVDFPTSDRPNKQFLAVCSDGKYSGYRRISARRITTMNQNDIETINQKSSRWDELTVPMMIFQFC